MPSRLFVSWLALALAACTAVKQEGETCASASDCAKGIECRAGVCARATAGCSTDAQCSEEASRCVAGTCLPAACGSTPCRPGSGCLNDRCADADCVAVSCPAGTACAGGSCASVVCNGVACGPRDVCVDGLCSSVACVGVICPVSQLCADGFCADTQCGATVCASGHVCSDGSCAEVACVGVLCPNGLVCIRGICSPPCSDAAQLQTDPDNCGSCGARCASPVHATRRCTAGVCGRSTCEPGFVDVDGPGTFGCESSCAGTTCTTPSGTITLAAPPLPEGGDAWSALSSATGHGGLSQTSATHANVGILGDPTPGNDGTLTSSSATHVNFGGFNAMLSKGQ